MFLHHSDKKTSFVTAAAFSTGREEQISQCEIRCLSSTGQRQQWAWGCIHHQNYCWAVSERGEKYHKKASARKTPNPSCPPSGQKSGKDAVQQLNIVYYFCVGFRCGAQIRRYPSWPEDSIMAPHNMFTVYTQQHTKAMPRNQFPLTFMNKNLIHLPLCAFIKEDKRREETH